MESCWKAVKTRCTQDTSELSTENEDDSFYLLTVRWLTCTQLRDNYVSIENPTSDLALTFDVHIKPSAE